MLFAYTQLKFIETICSALIVFKLFFFYLIASKCTCKFSQYLWLVLVYNIFLKFYWNPYWLKFIKVEYKVLLVRQVASFFCQQHIFSKQKIKSQHVFVFFYLDHNEIIVYWKNTPTPTHLHTPRTHTHTPNSLEANDLNGCPPKSHLHQYWYLIAKKGLHFHLYLHCWSLAFSIITYLILNFISYFLMLISTQNKNILQLLSIHFTQSVKIITVLFGSRAKIYNHD